MSIKYAAKGVKIKAGAAPAPTTEVPGIKEAGLIGGGREMIDTTNHGSIATKEQIPEPLRAVRGIEVTLFFDPADTEHARILAAYTAGTLEYQTFVLPDAGAAEFTMSGYITEFTVPTLGTTGALEAKYTFMAAGADTFTV